MRTRRRKNNPECVHCAFNCPSAVITARPRPGASKHCARPWPGGGEWPRPRADPPSKGQGSEPEGVGAADNPPSPAQARNPALPQGPPQPRQPPTAPPALHGSQEVWDPQQAWGRGQPRAGTLGGGAAGLTRQAGFVSEKDKRSHLRAQNHMWKVTEAGSLDVLMAGPGPRPPPGAPHGHGAGASTGEGKQRAPPDRGASRDSRGCEAGCW